MRGLRVHLAADGDRLICNAPKGVLTAELKAALSRHKPEVLRLLRSDVGAGLPMPITRVDPGSTPPVSFQQQRLWFLEQMAPHSAVYNIAGALRLSGRLDREALERSLKEILRRHEVLRTGFENVDGVPRPVIGSAAHWRMDGDDLEKVPAPDREQAILQRARAEAERPFDLTRGPLLRASLLVLGPAEHVLLLAMHHIASDGWSLGVFVRELAQLYTAFCAGQPSPLEELPIQYQDYACWQRHWAESSAIDSHLAYWKDQLSGTLPLIEIPSVRPRPSIQTFNGRRCSYRIPESLTSTLKVLSRQENCTLFMTLLAAFQVLLFRYTAQEDVIVGTASANRSRPELNDLIGFFVNNLVLRADLSGDPTFRELLGRVRDMALKAYTHQDAPFDQLVEALRPDRNLATSPLFQVMFILQNFPMKPLQLPGLTLSPIEIDAGTARFDLSVEICERDGALQPYFEYNTDLFDEESILGLQRHFTTLLERAAAAPDTPISRMPMLSAGEQSRILVEWNRTPREEPSSLLIHQLIGEQAARTPRACAVEFEGSALSYGDLDRRANQIAHAIRKTGGGPGKLVGICAGRSPAIILAALGALKSGSAYVPLDPSYPRQRLAFMMEDAGLSVLLTEEHLLEDLPAVPCPVLCLDRDGERIAREKDTAPDTGVTPDDLAYVIYTSGSTGTPKGVEVMHRSVVNLLHSMRRAPGLSSGDRLLSVTTLSFDIAGLEIYLPLMTGATIVFAGRTTVFDGIRLAALLRESRASVMQATPATWRLLLASGWSGAPGLKVLCGGEALPADLARALLARSAEVWNLYGPTETTIWSTCHRVREDEDPVPIGRPIGNTSVYILDKQQQPVPVNVPGELYIGGDNLARGYHNQPGLTAERFVPDKFTVQAGARMYRTGDLARYRTNGTIEYLGRLDQQIKIRGFRIEMGEIESVLATHQHVRQAVVTAREDVPGDQRLVAYVTGHPGSDLTSSDLSQWLSARLPDYMVPRAFVFLREFPLTPNGKVDRRALSAPGEQDVKAASTFLPPRNETEREIASLWRDVLKTDRVGLHDNFFDLGGHSLLVVQLQTRLRGLFGREVSLVELFQSPTVSAMSKLLSAQ